MNRAVNGEYVNLKKYVERMKEQYWQDWDQIVGKSREEKEKLKVENKKKEIQDEADEVEAGEELISGEEKS